MKTVSGILLSLGMVVFLAGVSFSQVASTASPAKTSAKPTTAAPAKVTDDNKSGTCNHHAGKETCTQGKNFVDKNGDGICDNCGSSGKCKDSGCGQCQKNGTGCGKSQGKGCCENQGKGSGCGKGQQNASGCQHQGTAPATKPKK